MLLTLAALALHGLVFAPSRSDAYLYWITNDDTIVRAKNDGTVLDPQFLWSTVDSPTDVAVNSTNIFWVNNSDNSVHQALIDGSGAQTTIPGGLTSAWGVTANASHLFYTNVAAPFIGRKSLSTGTLDQALVSQTGQQPLDVVVDANYIYWVTGVNTIGRANLDGTGVNASFITGLDEPRSIAVNGTHIFWTNSGSNSIGRANLDGSGPNSAFIQGTASPRGLAINGTYIYWTNFNPNSIGRATLAGGSVNQSFAPLSSYSGAIAVDGLAPSPTLVIDSGPNGPTNDPTPTFGFTAQAGATVTCSVDTGTPSFGPCSGPGSTHTPTARADGPWTFRVKAGDGVGPDNIQTRSFTVDATAPDTNIDSGPTGTVTDPDALFTFSSPDGTADFECRLDGGTWEACSSPEEYTALALGSHTFEVRASDPLDNVDATPASRGFTVSAADEPDPPDPPDPPSNPGPPSNAFTFGKVTLDKKKGTATLEVTVPGAGDLTILGSKTVGAFSAAARSAGTVVLPVKAKGKAAKILKGKGKVTVTAEVTFTPIGGTAKTDSKPLKLVRKAKERK